jgi:hypothetical protein
MMLSGLRWQKCKSCPRKFAVLIGSMRIECLTCERKREKRRGHRSNFPQAVK